MKIAICEDEEVIAQKLWTMLFDQEDIEAKYFTNPFELLKSYETGERFDILFCDAVMEPMDGIHLCKEIRKADQEVYIVFITNYIEFAPQGYEVGAFRYLLKPVSEESIEKVITEIREDMQKSSKVLLKTAEGNIILNAKDILYAEIKDKEACIHYNDDTVIVNRSLSELEELLKHHDFFRIHRKYLVNLERVMEFDQSFLTLDNGKTIPISIRKAADFKKALYRLLEKK